ncbi:MAG: DUF58 domain-containing protein [bacterium]
MKTTGAMRGDRAQIKISPIDRMIERISLGPALFVIAGIVFLVALNRGIALLYGASALTLAIAAIGYLYPWINLQKLSVDRKSPAVAHAGDNIIVQLKVSSRRRWPCWMLMIRETLPFRGPAEQPQLVLPSFRKHQHFSYQLHCDVRGEFYFGEPVVTTGFPFGLIERSELIAHSDHRLLVYPVPFDIHDFPLLEGRTDAMDEQLSNLPTNGHQEFHSIREYQYGDTPRHINWHHYARRKTLAVNQFGNPVDSSLHLVLDTNWGNVVGGRVHNTFEDAITIALSIARFALDRSVRVGMTLPGPGGAVLRPRSGGGQYLAIREMLARIKALDDRAFGAVATASLGDVHEASQHVLFCLDRDLPGLSQLSHDPSCVLICFNSVSYEKQEDQSKQSSWASPGRRLNIYHGESLSHAFR